MSYILNRSMSLDESLNQQPNLLSEGEGDQIFVKSYTFSAKAYNKILETEKSEEAIEIEKEIEKVVVNNIKTVGKPQSWI